MFYYLSIYGVRCYNILLDFIRFYYILSLCVIRVFIRYSLFLVVLNCSYMLDMLLDVIRCYYIL